MTDEPLLDVKDLTISFDGFEALHQVSFSVPRGLLVGLIGPNGCGKSTMMKCISRLHTSWSGTVKVDGEDVSRMRPADIAKVVANVPAEVGSIYGMSVMDMVMLGRYPFVNRVWWESEDDEKAVREALRTFGLDHYRRKQVTLLSSGEKQRTLIAKAYVQHPKLMLVDEPTSHLDMKYKLEVMEYLQKMARSDMTVMVAEHDISLMARYCDLCIIMKKGSIVTIGDPKTVIDEDLIRRVYEVESCVGTDREGEIYVLPKRYIRTGGDDGEGSRGPSPAVGAGAGPRAGVRRVVLPHGLVRPPGRDGAVQPAGRGRRPGGPVAHAGAGRPGGDGGVLGQRHHADP